METGGNGRDRLYGGVGALEFRGFRGESPIMHRCFERAEAFAHFTAPVLIFGETGTGKRNTAKAIHQASGRQGQFVVVDCTNIPRDLLASHLFGHERGAFTGATGRRIGFIEEAENGTLVLDEVENLPPDVQQMLLMTTDSKRAIMRSRRLGGGRLKDHNVRLVCATNIDLQASVEKGAFRKDLYYRISTLKLRMPPLRERGTAYFLELVNYLLQELYEENKNAHDITKPLTVDSTALAELLKYSWPGNIRELINVLYEASVNALIVRRVYQITVQDFPDDFAENAKRAQATSSSPTEDLRKSVFREVAAVTELPGRTSFLRGADKIYLAQLLHEARGDIPKAAAASGLRSHHLRALLRRHGLQDVTSGK